jgi:hypothetical protein
VVEFLMSNDYYKEKIWKNLIGFKHIDELYTYWQAMEENNDIDNISEDSQPDATLPPIQEIDFIIDPLVPKAGKIIHNEDQLKHSDELLIKDKNQNSKKFSLGKEQMEEHKISIPRKVNKKISTPMKSILKPVGQKSSHKNNIMSSVHFEDDKEYSEEESIFSIKQEFISEEDDQSSSSDGQVANLQYQYENQLKSQSNSYLTDIQVELWKIINSEQIWIKLWFTKFNFPQKVALWNKLLLPPIYLENLQTMYKDCDFSVIKCLFDKDKVEAEEKVEEKAKAEAEAKVNEDNIAKFHNEEILETQNKMVITKSKITKNEAMQMLAKLIISNSRCLLIGMFQNKAGDDDTLQEQMNESHRLFKLFDDKFGDKKMFLWIALSLEQKISMILHEKNFTQFSFLLLLLMEQHDPVFKNLKRTDKYLESLINNLIYEKYIGLCQLKAFIAREISMEKR